MRLQCGRSGFDPWVGKVLWRKEWLPTPVFLPENSMDSVQAVHRSLLFFFLWLCWVFVTARRLFIGVCGLLSSCRVPKFSGCSSRASNCKMEDPLTQTQLPHSMWDLTPQTRGQTHVPCIRRQIVNYYPPPSGRSLYQVSSKFLPNLSSVFSPKSQPPPILLQWPKGSV